VNPGLLSYVMQTKSVDEAEEWIHALNDAANAAVRV
jgi:hypothetical protein